MDTIELLTRPNVLLGTIVLSTGYGVAYNSYRPNSIVFIKTNNLAGDICMNSITLNANQRLDIVADKYYNQGYSNLTLTID